MPSDEKALHLCGLTSKTHDLSLTMRKTLNKPKFKYILQNTQLVFIKTVMVIKHKESLRNCHRAEKVRRCFN